MASAGVIPTPDIHRGIEALERDLPLVLKGRNVEEAGWCRPDAVALLIPLYAKAPNGRTDFYLLKLDFSCYPEWPPSAQFVNPLTQKYVPGQDKMWLPNCTGGNEIAFHDNVQGKQLICCSTTLEFYEVRHGVEERHIWQHPQQNFSATLAAIRFALLQPRYLGPLEPRP